MDFLNRSFAQLADLFRTMTPGARITTGVLLAVLAVGLAYLFQSPTESAHYYLFGGQDLSESEIDALEVAFAAKGLNGWERDGFRLRVPHADRYKYLAAAAEADALPVQPGGALDRMIRADNPLNSQQTRELQANNAKRQDMVASIRQLEYVLNASLAMDQIRTR